MFKKRISDTLLRECFSTFVMNHGAILTGLTLSYAAILIPQLKGEKYYSDTFMESVIASISILTIGVTTLFSMFIIGQTSRKRIIQTSLAVYGVGTLIVIFSRNILSVCIGLVVQSAVVSIFLPVTMAYISEISLKEHRGSLLSSVFISTTFGLALNYILNSAVSWRTMAFITLLITVSGFMQTFFIPESNYWYLLEGKEELAQESILWFEPALSAEEVNQRIEAILLANETFNFQKGDQFSRIIRSLKDKKFYKPVLLGILINVFRSGNGRVMVGIHLETVLNDLNTPYNVLHLIRWFGWADILGSFVILLFVHKIRRKTLMYVSCAVLVLSLGVIVAFKFAQGAGDFIPPWVPIVSLYVYAICVITTYNSLVTIIISEIQVPIYRVQMNLFHNSVVYLFCSLSTFVFPYVEKILPIQYIFLWFIFNIIASVIVIRCTVSETSNLEFFENKKNTKCEKPA